MSRFFEEPKKILVWVNTSKGKRTPIPSIKDDDTWITNDTVKAEKFNHYFYSVFTQEDMSNFDSLKKSLDFAPCLLSTVKFLPQEVFAQLHSIDVSKAYRGVARLTLMVGHTFCNTTLPIAISMACWFIRAFIYGCFKKCKVRVAIDNLE